MLRIGLLGIVACLSMSLDRVVFGNTIVLGAARDNTLYSSTTGEFSNGQGQNLFAGTLATLPANRRCLLYFDVAGALPTSAIVTNATLRLRMSRTISGAQPASLHRVTQAWGEGTSNANGQEGMGAPATNGDATWIHASQPGQFWMSPGGDFVAAPSAVRDVGGVGFYNWGSTPEMLADLQHWLHAPAKNFGWILIVDESVTGTAKRFDSREHPIAANRPLLTIDYIVAPEPTMFVHLHSLLLALSSRVVRLVRCLETLAC